MFSKLGAAKFVASTIVGIGAGKVVGQIIKEHIKPETMVDKIVMTAATFAIGGLVTAAAKKYTNDSIDEVVSGVSRGVTVIKEAEKVGRINRGESTFEAEGLNKAEFKEVTESTKNGVVKTKWVRDFDNKPAEVKVEPVTSEQ